MRGKGQPYKNTPLYIIMFSSASTPRMNFNNYANIRRAMHFKRKIQIICIYIFRFPRSDEEEKRYAWRLSKSKRILSKSGCPGDTLVVPFNGGLDGEMRLCPFAAKGLSWKDQRGSQGNPVQ